MQLLYAPTSPFVRKVMICAHLCGLADQVELLDSAAHPVRRDERIARHNPLAQVPTMILPEGAALYDSRVICEYLAALAGNNHLFPETDTRRWTALTQQALGDGILDAALLARYERTARPLQSQSDSWRAAQLVKVQAGLQDIEARSGALVIERPTIGEVTLGCALGYLDFRFPEIDWRAGHPGAARWFEAFSGLPAMQATIPHEA